MNHILDNLKNFYPYVREGSTRKLLYLCLKATPDIVKVMLKRIIVAYNSDYEIRKELDKVNFFNQILQSAIHTNKQWLVLLLVDELDLNPDSINISEMKEELPHLYQQFIAIYEKRNLFINFSNEKEENKELISSPKL